MWSFLRKLFGTDFMPHLYCLRGEPGVLWLHVVSDLLTALSYYAIPLVLFSVLLRRKDLLFRRVAVLFVLFIAACGTTHVLAIWTIWYPMYRLEGLVKGFTAVVSVITALVLVRLLPDIHRLPSVADLEKEIAERRYAEQQLRIQAARTEQFLGSFADYVIYRLDARGYIETWNLGGERIVGYRAEEIIGQHFSILYAPEEVAAGRPQEALDKLAEVGRLELEGWRMRKDGSRFWAHVDVRSLFDEETGKVRGFANITRDMTEARAMEAKFKALLESAPDAMVIVDARGSIQLANRQTERLFGYAPAELIGQPVEVLVPETVRAQHAGHRGGFFASPKKREMGAGLDLSAVRKDGTLFPVEISLSPLDGPHGVFVTAAIRDITDRKLAAQQLAQKMEELRHSNQELEQFAHIASHDLQEPLRMVASYVQLLSKRYRGKLDADADEFIGYAVDGTQRMKRLIEDLLVYSRAGKGAPPIRAFRSEEALEEALKNLRTTIEERGAVVTHDRLPVVTAVDTQLAQIFQNLIGNGIKYCADAVPRIHVSALRSAGVDGDGAEWVFSVRDNGIGIDPKYFERVFVIFQRLHGREEYAGTGIGLAICKRILQQQGGRIWVESELGHGSTFHFALPAREL